MLKNNRVDDQKNQEIPSHASLSIGPLLCLFLFFWTGAFAASLWYSLIKLEKYAVDSAHIQALSAFEKDVLYRRWNARLGGILAPVVPGVLEPNPYLPIHGRDVTTPDGALYTKVNPAFMTRLVHELEAMETGVLGHITSTMPIRKGNEPDDWERAALHQLEAGVSHEISSLETMNGVSYLRFIRPLMVEESCLPCHQGQGYVLGQVRGGISISVPMAPFRQSLLEGQRWQISAHVGLWTLGMLGIGFAAFRLSRGVKEHAKFVKMGYWYESILDAIPFPISVKDTEAKWRFANTTLEKILKRKRADIIGTRCSGWGSGICDTGSCAVVCAQQGKEQQTYFEHAGSSYQIDVAALKDMHGETTGFIEVIQDITKMEMLAKERADAEAASRAKSAFLARMSHEIRTPMNAILGITEIQTHNASLSEDVKEAFGRIYAAGYTLLNIINDILDLSKIEAGKMELLPVKYDVASLISDTAQLNIMRIGSKPIEFKLEVDEDLPSTLFGDELRIRQVLNNLLSNAFKYTQKGEVILSVAAEYGGTDENCDVTLVFRVSDTGQGMSEDQVRRLFDEYSRFYLEADRTVEGIGLGMNITRQLIQLMNGEIFVESAMPGGSTFTVRLPQARVDDGRLDREATVTLQRFKGGATHLKTPQIAREPMPYGSVLIVDDLETNLYVSKGLMAPYGLSVDTALSGEEAIDKIRGGKEYDIVFMDHMMPKMDGVEAVKILRDLGYAGAVVALTANAVAGQAEMFLENGFDDFLSKPIDLRLLNALLNRLVRDTQPPETLEAACRQKGYAGAEAPPASLDSQLAAIFIRDAEKTLAALEAMHANQYRRGDDNRMFIITVHAIKSALANIGETELSAFAHRLEQAGRAVDTAVIMADTPVFLDGLRVVIEKITPTEEGEGSQMADEDQAYLRAKLSAIQAACSAYDKKAAKDALAELRQKAWPSRIREQLDAVSVHLLHSEFEEASGAAEKVCSEQWISG